MRGISSLCSDSVDFADSEARPECEVHTSVGDGRKREKECVTTHRASADGTGVKKTTEK